jgi:excisionase family DNA binding protein
MTASTIAERTYFPDDREDLGQVFRFLVDHAAQPNDPPRYMLVGPTRGDRVAMPAEVHRVLLQVVESLQAGKAVTVAPLSMTLTTQQAADLLNVSRPTVVKLIEEGQIPFERLSHRRQVRLADVLAYRERRRTEQLEAIAATSDPWDDEDDPAEVLERLAQARKTVAARRRRERQS